MTNDDNQPITKKDLEASLGTFGKQISNAIVTQLRGEMQAMERGLRGEMQSVEKGLRSEMDAQEEKVVTRIRDELDSKLAATTHELKRHTEDIVAVHSGEILDSIAHVVEPLQAEVNRHTLRLDELEAKVA